MPKSSCFASGKHCAKQYAAVISSNNREIEEITRKVQGMRIEVVDDTALVDTSLISKGKLRQQTKNAIPMKKKPRKDWKIKKIKKGKAYSRSEMVALSLRNFQDQRNKWSEVYAALTPSVAAEYDGLLAAPPLFPRPIFIHNFDGGASAMGKRSPLKISVH